MVPRRADAPRNGRRAHPAVRKKRGIMTILRWLAFIPAGFVAAIIAGFLGNFGASIFPGITWVAWSTSGAFSAAAFIFVGLRVAPARNRVAKWTLIILSLLLVSSQV